MVNPRFKLIGVVPLVGPTNKKLPPVIGLVEAVKVRGLVGSVLVKEIV